MYEQLMQEKEALLTTLVAQNVFTEEQKAEALNLYSMQLINNGIMPEAQTAPQEQSVEQQCSFTYQTIDDLYLPNLTPEDKTKAIALANKIEQLRTEMITKQNAGIAVSDVEIDSLNRMIKDFKKFTKVGFHYAMADKCVRGKDKVCQLVSNGTDMLHDKSTGFVDDISDGVLNSTISGLGELGVQTIEFGSNLAQGIVTLNANAVKGIITAGCNLFRARK